MPHTTDVAGSGTNGHSTIGEALYALSDEQILEIDDTSVRDDVILSEGRAAPEAKDQRPESETAGAEPSAAASQHRSVSDRDRALDSSLAPASPPLAQNDKAAAHDSQATNHESPPVWLAQAMNDPQLGGEARQFWESAQQTRAQAAQLASLDHAYFGVADAPAAERSASREALAQQLFREDPAAFREMLTAGLRSLGVKNIDGVILRADASHRPEESTPRSRPATNDRPGESRDPAIDSSLGRQTGLAQNDNSTQAAHESIVTKYAAFEHAANDDLDRAVRPEIARVLERALPAGNNESAHATHERLSAMVRTEVETALRQDRALGEQVAQLLRSRTFDEPTRAQVVRLISSRAASLIPAASRRVLAEWTQSALAAHRARRSSGGESFASVTPSERSESRDHSSSSAAREKNPQRDSSASLAKTARAARNDNVSSSRSRGINYRALSDEDILNL